jgi:phosphatidylglycerol:prolipoprotein diacylglycerol transferase
MSAPLMFPEFDPVAFEIGPLVIRWYALAYIAGLVGGWQLATRLAKTELTPAGFRSVRPVDIDDFLTWATLGVILGGRIGYVLFYNLDYYLANPLEAFALWKGGMAFHGGFAGVVVAALIFAKKRGISVFCLGDLLATVAPIGLCLGRIANFINGELFGRIAPDAPLAMIFPNGGPLPRHPSQLYQAGLEGLLLFMVMIVAWSKGSRLRPGMQCGIFFAGYGIARIIGEMFRQPDPQLGFLLGGITMGQVLSLPMVLIGVAFIRYSLSRPAISVAVKA